MHPIALWLVAFALPALGSFAAAYLLEHRGDGLRGLVAGRLVIHAGLILSILLSLHFIHADERLLPLRTAWYSVALLWISIVVAIVFAGWLGIAYAASGFVQQLCIVCAAALLMPSFPALLLALLIAPIYAAGHLIHMKRWRVKLPITFAWGIASVLVYLWLNDLLLLSAVHILGGTLLMRRGIIYAR